MPRGVYDRSKMKSKKAASKEAATAPAALSAAPQKKTWKSKPGPKPKRKPIFTGTAGTVSASIGGMAADVNELYQHLHSVTQARVQIGGQQAAHNEQLLATIDGEIAGTVTSLKIWREQRFPVLPTAEKQEASKEEPKKAAAPASNGGTQHAAPAPAPVPQVTPGAPPLPFTPAAVQEVMKNAGQPS